MFLDRRQGSKRSARQSERVSTVSATGNTGTSGFMTCLAFIALAGGKIWWDEGKRAQGLFAFASAALLVGAALYKL